MEKNEKIELSGFQSYIENYLDLLPNIPNSPNANIWVKGEEMEISGNHSQGSQQEIKVKLCESSNWPETKTEWELICRTVLGVRICTHGSVSYRRSCNKRFYLVLKHPSLDTVKLEIEDCLKISTVVAISILLSTGNIGLATTSFKESFVTCLESKGVQIARSISIKISEEKNCGSWRHIS